MCGMHGAYIQLQIIQVCTATTHASSSQNLIKKHSSESCGLRKMGYPNTVSILTGRVKSRFSCICTVCLSRLLYSKGALHSGKATFRILKKSLQLFPRYEEANIQKDSSFFLFRPLQWMNFILRVKIYSCH